MNVCGRSKDELNILMYFCIVRMPSWRSMFVYVDVASEVNILDPGWEGGGIVYVL